MKSYFQSFLGNIKDLPETKTAFACPVCNSIAKFDFSVSAQKTFIQKEKKLYNFKIYRCQRCGLGFVKPLPSEEELANLYQENYYQGNQDFGYLSAYENLEIGLKKTYITIIKKTQTFCKRKIFHSVLDIGCAYGFFLDCASLFLASNLRVGIDISDTVKKIVSQKGHYFIKGFFEEVNISDQFDLIFMGDVFEHIRDPWKAFKKIDCLLKSGGVLVITTVNFSSLVARIFRTKWRLMTPPEHLLFWTPKALKLFFEQKGWQGIVSNYWLYYPKKYIEIAFKKQFGFHPFFLWFLPVKIMPIPSYDVKLAIFRKP